MNGVDILEKLNRCREKREKGTNEVLQEVNRILNKSIYSERNVLQHLKSYNQLVEVVDETEVNPQFIFSQQEIREIALSYRLRFVNSQSYRYEFPYEAVLKIEHHNAVFRKTLKGFKILGTSDFFRKKNCNDSALLFAPTSMGNYYLLHQWGQPLKWHRKWLSWPLRNIENLLITLLFVTLIMTLSVPQSFLVILDHKATYWCAYRIGVFFHLLIFNMGFTAYFTFAFSRNLGNMIWDSEKGLMRS